MYKDVKQTMVADFNFHLYEWINVHKRDIAKKRKAR